MAALFLAYCAAVALLIPSPARPARRVSALRGGSAVSVLCSAGCIAIQAPLASRSRADRPWWSGWMWVTTIPVTSAGSAPAALRPSARACHPASEFHPGSTTTRPLPTAIR